MSAVRKLLSCILVSAVFMLCAVPIMAGDDIKVTLNGEALVFDVKPQIINDRTMVPLRAIFEALGATVDWNQDTKTILSQKDDRKVMLSIGKKSMSVNDNTVEIDTPAQIVENRTLVPVRAISEAYDADVTWDAETKTVVIVDNSPNAPVAPTSEKQAEYESLAKKLAYYKGGGNLPRYDSVVDCGKEIKADEIKHEYYYKYTSDEDINTYIEVAKLKEFSDFREDGKIILVRKPLDYISVEKSDEDTVKVVARRIQQYTQIDFVDMAQIVNGLVLNEYRYVPGSSFYVDRTNSNWYEFTSNEKNYVEYRYYYYPQVSIDIIKKAIDEFNKLYDYMKFKSTDDKYYLIYELNQNKEYGIRIWNGKLGFKLKNSLSGATRDCTMVQIIVPEK